MWALFCTAIGFRQCSGAEARGLPGDDAPIVPNIAKLDGDIYCQRMVTYTDKDDTSLDPNVLGMRPDVIMRDISRIQPKSITSIPGSLSPITKSLGVGN